MEVTRRLEFDASWKNWAGATRFERLCAPPVFKPGHVLFPLADGSYLAEENSQVRGLRWRVVPQVVETPQD